MDAAAINPTWILSEIKEDVKTADPARVARRLGGIVANDERVREAIRSALEDSSESDGSVLAERVLESLAAAIVPQKRRADGRPNSDGGEATNRF
jgi:hypothetical protein